MDLLALLANVYFAVDELARELKDKSKDYNPIHHQQQFANLAQKYAPNPAFHSLTKHSNYSTTPRLHRQVSVEQTR